MGAVRRPVRLTQPWCPRAAHDSGETELQFGSASRGRQDAAAPEHGEQHSRVR